MRNKKLLTAAGLVIFGCAATIAKASTTQAAPTAAELQQMTAEMAAMQQKMAAMQTEMAQLKTKLAQAPKATTPPSTPVSRSTTVAAAQPPASHATEPTAKASPAGPTTPFGGFSPFGNWVVEGPYTNTPTHYNGMDLIVNAPSVNEGHKLLVERAKENAYSMSQIGQPQQTPRLVLSGSVVGIAQATRPYSGKPQSNIDLTTVELDNMMEISSWVTGFAAFTYNNEPSPGSPRAVDNSQVQVDRAFILLGNLDKAPVYGELGQLYVPFGRYVSYMVSSPLTQFVGKTKARAATFGYHPNTPDTPYVTIFAFQGDANDTVGRIDNFGFDTGYRYRTGLISGNFGISYLNDIADSDGIQDTGSSTAFTGFAASSSTEILKHGVSGGDIHMDAGSGPISFIAEYVSALQSFYKGNLSFNNHGARPAAMHIEAAYGFQMFFNLPASLAVGYGHTYQALGINLPRNRYIMTLTQTISKYTLVSLELRHDINYGTHDSATGQGMVADTPNQLGRADNVATLQLGIYF